MLDLWAGLKSWRVWTALAWSDLVVRYHSTSLGLIWIVFNYLVLVIVKVAIFGALNEEDVAYFAVYVAIGFLIWQLINQVLIDGANCFYNSRAWLLGVPLPVSVPVYQTMWRHVIVFVISSVSTAAIAAYFGVSSTHIPMAFAGLVVLVLALFPATVLLAVLCTRFRDLGHLLQAIMRVMFFLTPILWVPSQLGNLAQFALYNPFFHLINIVRAPLLDGTVPTGSWVYVGVMAGLLWSASLLAYQLSVNRIVKWI